MSAADFNGAKGGAPPVEPVPSKPGPWPAEGPDRVEMIERSVQCFYAALAGFVPFVGVVPALGALRAVRALRGWERTRWNPARRQRRWARGLAWAGLVGNVGLWVWVVVWMVSLWIGGDW